MDFLPQDIAIVSSQAIHKKTYNCNISNKTERYSTNKTLFENKTSDFPVHHSRWRATSQWNSSCLSWHHRFGGGGASPTSWRSVGGFEMASDTCTSIVSRDSNSDSFWNRRSVHTDHKWLIYEIWEYKWTVYHLKSPNSFRYKTSVQLISCSVCYSTFRSLICY